MSAASPALGTPCGYCGKRSTTIFARRNKWACFSCYMAHPANVRELSARMQRAVALAGVLLQFGTDSAAARAMTDTEWQMAAEAAKIGNPPSLETRQMVIHALEDYRRNSNV